MSILGIGIDAVDIHRIEKALRRERFASVVFTECEREFCERQATPARHFAGRFVAKEAAFKTLGLKRIRFQDFETLSEEGMPLMVLHGPTHDAAAEMGVTNIALSISHTRGMAIAVAIAMGQPGGA